MHDENTVREELREVLSDAYGDRKPLGRMPMRRATLISLWILRVYVVVMLGLIGLKFLQMAGIM